MCGNVNDWLNEYEENGFVKHSIYDESQLSQVGDVEIFNKPSADKNKKSGLLKLNLRYDYDDEKDIEHIISTILKATNDIFDCELVTEACKC